MKKNSNLKIKGEAKINAKSKAKGYAMITGASSGIGAATAKALAAEGFHVLLVARRESRLKALAERLKNDFSIEAKWAAVDLTHEKAVLGFCQQFSKELKNCTVLVNNAGLARGVSKAQEADLQDWNLMIETNIKAVFRLTRLLLPKMLKHSTSTIVNLGSVAGRWVYPGGAVYCATKHAIKAFSEGLRMDALGTGLRVVNIEPGMVETEFSEVRLGSKDKAKAVYAGMKPLTAEDIAETIVWSIQRPQHVTIQEMVIFPTAQASVRDVHRKG
jgi:NADP-dependent 3-hydroxy acid dehydrogenase YdfG